MEQGKTQYQQLQECLTSKWIDTFKKHTFKTRIVKLDEEFINYLNSDGIIINQVYEQSKITDKQFNQLYQQHSQNQHNQNTKKNSENDSDEDSDTEQCIFPNIDKQIQEILENFDNETFIKLNWKSPRDATEWIKELKCETIHDIILLLKSSSIITDILDKKYSQKNLCVQKQKRYHMGISYQVNFYQVDLKPLTKINVRRWYKINHSLEFRCFLKDKQLIGICQKKCAAFYPFYGELKDIIIQLITNFVNTEFKDTLTFQNVVMDLYLEKKTSTNSYKVWIMDFNVWGPMTESLLFCWDELQNQIPNSDIEFRYIKSHNEVMYEDYTDFKVPSDFLGEEKSENITEFLEKLQKKEEFDSNKN